MYTRERFAANPNRTGAGIGPGDRLRESHSPSRSDCRNGIRALGSREGRLPRHAGAIGDGRGVAADASAPEGADREAVPGGGAITGQISLQGGSSLCLHNAVYWPPRHYPIRVWNRDVLLSRPTLAEEKDGGWLRPPFLRSKALTASALSKTAATQPRRTGNGNPAEAIWVAVLSISRNLKLAAMIKSPANINRAMRIAVVRHNGTDTLVFIG